MSIVLGPVKEGRNASIIKTYSKLHIYVHHIIMLLFQINSFSGLYISVK